jgi:hypothetical protein
MKTNLIVCSVIFVLNIVLNLVYKPSFIMHSKPNKAGVKTVNYFQLVLFSLSISVIWFALIFFSNKL